MMVVDAVKFRVLRVPCKQTLVAAIVPVGGGNASNVTDSDVSVIQNALQLRQIPGGRFLFNSRCGITRFQMSTRNVVCFDRFYRRKKYKINCLKHQMEPFNV